MTTILVIPDSHSEPGVDNERFYQLGCLIYDYEPDVVVHLGDHFDLASLGKYDRGTLKGEGQRITGDLATGGEDLARVREPLSKRAIDSIAWEFCLGNHEDRADVFAHEHPEFEGTIGTHMLPLEGWRVHPYLQPVEVEGIYFAHYFPSGVQNRPIGGVNAARTALLKCNRSVVWGHSHEFHYGTIVNPIDGKAIHALNAGCFFRQHHEFAGPANKVYTRMIAVLRNVEDGTYDPEFISMDTLEMWYGEAK